MIGRKTEGGGSRYYMKGHLGSIRVVIDGSPDWVEQRDYYPFGLPMPGRYEKGSPPTTEDFTGHVKDEATGLHYAGARYYSAAFGVWNAVDPLAGDRPVRDPYAYAVGNPVNLMDPNGMEPCPYDKSQECGIILPEVEVTAEEPEETADAGVVGGTFYFNSSTREGRQALRDRLQQNPSAARRMLAQRATQRFTPTARKIAFEENIYAGQRQALQIALQTGADLATVASLLSGAGSAVGIGVCCLNGVE